MRRNIGMFAGMALDKLLSIATPSYKLTSGIIAPNRKNRNKARNALLRKRLGQGQGHLGRRAHDGTMDGPFRSSRGRG